MNATSPRVLAGRYRLEGLLGSGGMGHVWRAWDERLRRPVAVKLPRDPSAGQRFVREAQAMARLSHPGVVRIFEAGYDGDAAYLVQELLEGRDLETAFLADGPMAPERLRAVARDVAEALAGIHAAGLVHRDLKPANVFLEAGGRARLVDFGVALDPDLTKLTDTDAVVGTLQYVAPECLRFVEATPASDVYQFGLTMFRTLTGRLLDRDAERPMCGYNALVSEAVETPEPEGLPADWAELVRRCCRKSPSERIPDGAALVAALRGLWGPEAPRAAGRPPEPRPAPPSDRGRAVARSLGAVVLALLTALLGAAVVPRSGPPAVLRPTPWGAEAVGVTRLPDGFRLEVPRSAALARWSVERDSGAPGEGSFSQAGGAFVTDVVDVGGGPWRLVVRERGAVVLERTVEPAPAAFSSAPTVRVGPDWVRLTFELFGPSAVELWVAEDGGEPVLRSRGQRSVGLHGIAESVGRLDVQLRLGPRVLWSRRLTPGLRPVASPPRLPQEPKCFERFLTSADQTATAVYTSGLVASWRATPSPTGTVLAPDWFYDAGPLVPGARREWFRDTLLVERGPDRVLLLLPVPGGRALTLSRRQRRAAWAESGAAGSGLSAAAGEQDRPFPAARSAVAVLPGPGGAAALLSMDGDRLAVRRLVLDEGELRTAPEAAEVPALGLRAACRSGAVLWVGVVAPSGARLAVAALTEGPEGVSVRRVAELAPWEPRTFGAGCLELAPTGDGAVVALAAGQAVLVPPEPGAALRPLGPVPAGPVALYRLAQDVEEGGPRPGGPWRVGVVAPRSDLALPLLTLRVVGLDREGRSGEGRGPSVPFPGFFEETPFRCDAYRGGGCVVVCAGTAVACFEDRRPFRAISVRMAGDVVRCACVLDGTLFICRNTGPLEGYDLW